MAIDINDLPPWAQKQIADKIAKELKGKVGKPSATALTAPKPSKDTRTGEKPPEREKAAFGCEEFRITIPIPPVTKKNSQRIVQRGERHIPLPSKAYTKYEKDAREHLGALQGRMIDYPVEVTCLFYMATRRKADLTNLLEAIDDVLVHFGVLEDDNCRIIVSHDGSRVLYDKENPRTEIVIREV